VCADHWAIVTEPPLIGNRWARCNVIDRRRAAKQSFFDAGIRPNLRQRKAH
jgi:hypothetical protein